MWLSLRLPYCVLVSSSASLQCYREVLRNSGDTQKGLIERAGIAVDLYTRILAVLRVNIDRGTVYSGLCPHRPIMRYDVRNSGVRTDVPC
jgi:hypothetical protein